MTPTEFSTEFDVLYNNITSNQAPGLNEYEKSIFLTKAQEEIVLGYYDGKNVFGDSFESTEELRRQLDALVETKVYNHIDGNDDSVGGTGVSNNSVFFQLPSNLAFITMEQITFSDGSLGCYNHSRVNVQPTRQDEYNKIKDNPFRGATKYKALRLDAGNGKIEIISKYNFDKYLIRYVNKPEPIILEDLPNGLTIEGMHTTNGCKLNPILHKTILERAVLMALRTKTNTER